MHITHYTSIVPDFHYNKNHIDTIMTESIKQNILKLCLYSSFQPFSILMKANKEVEMNVVLKCQPLAVQIFFTFDFFPNIFFFKFLYRVKIHTFLHHAQMIQFKRIIFIWIFDQNGINQSLLRGFFLPVKKCEQWLYLE